MEICFKMKDILDFISIPPEVFLGKVFLKICSKFTAEHPCLSVIAIKLSINLVRKIKNQFVFMNIILLPQCAA